MGRPIATAVALLGILLVSSIGVANGRRPMQKGLCAGGSTLMSFYAKDPETSEKFYITVSDTNSNSFSFEPRLIGDAKHRQLFCFYQPQRKQRFSAIAHNSDENMVLTVSENPPVTGTTVILQALGDMNNGNDDQLWQNRIGRQKRVKFVPKLDLGFCPSFGGVGKELVLGVAATLPDDKEWFYYKAYYY